MSSTGLKKKKKQQRYSLMDHQLSRNKKPDARFSTINARHSQVPETTGRSSHTNHAAFTLRTLNTNPRHPYTGTGWNHHFTEYNHIGIDPAVAEGKAPALPGSSPLGAAVLCRFAPGNVEPLVPCLNQCCFPTGVSLELVSLADATDVRYASACACSNTRCCRRSKYDALWRIHISRYAYAAGSC